MAKFILIIIFSNQVYTTSTNEFISFIDIPLFGRKSQIRYADYIRKSRYQRPISVHSHDKFKTT